MWETIPESEMNRALYIALRTFVAVSFLVVSFNLTLHNIYAASP